MVDVKFHKLANGLQLIGEVNPANKSASIGFFVKTGSRDETELESGVSHFLEHMMFKGTAKRNALEITYQLGNLGAQANAYTSEENTVYYATVLTKYFPAMQELLSDMLRPALDPEEFNVEKKVILEEIALYQDRPTFYFFEKALGAYFNKHPAGNSVLGTTQSVGALTQPQMKNYFDRRYAPSNIVLVAAGNFDWDGFVSDAEKYCGAWAGDSLARKTERRPPNPIRRDYSRKNLSQAHILFVNEGASAQDSERYPLSVLSSILGDSSGSKLYWDLIDSGLADSAGCDSDDRDGTGCFMAYASTEPRNIDKVSEILRKVLSSPLSFDEGELERAKTKLESRIALGGELPFNRLAAIGTEWLYTGEFKPLAKIIERIKQVNRAEIEQALKRFTLVEWAEFRMLPE